MPDILISMDKVYSSDTFGIPVPGGSPYFLQYSVFTSLRVTKFFSMWRAKTRGWATHNVEPIIAAEYNVGTCKNMCRLTICLANSRFQCNDIQLNIILSESESVLYTQRIRSWSDSTPPPVLCPPIIIRGAPNGDHYLQQFVYYCVPIRCHGYEFQQAVL
jgi:hypothetical protein